MKEAVQNPNEQIIKNLVAKNNGAVISFESTKGEKGLTTYTLQCWIRNPQKIQNSLMKKGFAIRNIEEDSGSYIFTIF